VFLAIQNEREWDRFCRQVLERPELATDPRFTDPAGRVAHRDELEAMIGATLREASGEQVIERLEAAGIACARLKTLPQFLAHPQLETRGRWRAVHTPGGDVRALVPPVMLEGAAPRMDPVPSLGEHTTQVLTTLGIDESVMAAWRARGVI
jgi:formyl-CoA transferase